VRRQPTKSFWSNCWIVAIWLWLNGRYVRLVLTKSRSSRFPHLMGITRHGHTLGYCLGREPERAKACRFYPFWFRGAIGGVRKKYKHRMYGKRVILGKL
jgi:hypothetical protein